VEERLEGFTICTEKTGDFALVLEVLTGHIRSCGFSASQVGERPDPRSHNRRNPGCGSRGKRPYQATKHSWNEFCRVCQRLENGQNFEVNIMPYPSFFSLTQEVADSANGSQKHIANCVGWTINICNVVLSDGLTLDRHGFAWPSGFLGECCSSGFQASSKAQLLRENASKGCKKLLENT
jgi:hypothetical protein